MKKNVAIVFLGALLFISLVANYFLLERSVEGSYALDFQPRLIEDTRVLSTSINQEISAEELINQIRDRTSGIKIEQFQNRKSQWDQDGPIYAVAIRAGNLTYYFNGEDRLIRVDHWLAQNSPLYERAR